MLPDNLSTVALSLCPFVEPRTIRKYLAAFDQPEAAFTALDHPWREEYGVRRESFDKLQRWSTRMATTDVPGFLHDHRVSAVLRGEDDYPDALNELADPPHLLFLRGDRTLLQSCQKSVGVVGTRRASGYGLEAAAWIANVLAGSGCPIISGMAIGIDGQAHRGALEASGQTIAVLGTSIDVCYPPAHQSLYRSIWERGLILSEYPPGTAAARHRFPERNRLIAALSSRLVIVQAGEKSGALHTVDLALELGRDVYAVPGPITSVHHRGSNRLLQEGAMVLVEPTDVIRDLGGASGELSEPMQPPRWRELFEALQLPADAQALASALGTPISHVFAGLLELEVDGWIERLPGGRYQRRQPAAVQSTL